MRKGVHGYFKYGCKNMAPRRVIQPKDGVSQSDTPSYLKVQAVLCSVRDACGLSIQRAVAVSVHKRV